MNTNSERKRKAPFTTFEKAFLRELVAEQIDVIESKKTDSEQSRRKLSAWKSISNKYNANPQCQPATADQLKKLWLNMKSKARDAKTAIKQRCHTGGGPYIPDMNPEEDAVLEMIPNVLPTIKVTQDSDGFGDQDGDEDDNSWLSLKNRNVITPIIEERRSTTTSTATATQPSSSTTSATTTATATQPSTSNTSTNLPPPNEPHVSRHNLKRKQPNVDQLKCQLIQQEIEHREKKNQQEIEHQKNMSQLEYDILLLEYTHKKRLYEIIENNEKRQLNEQVNSDVTNP